MRVDEIDHLQILVCIYAVIWRITVTGDERDESNVTTSVRIRREKKTSTQIFMVWNLLACDFRDVRLTSDDVKL